MPLGTEGQVCVLSLVVEEMLPLGCGHWCEPPRRAQTPFELPLVPDQLPH